MISCNMRSSDKPRIPPPSDRANYEPSVIEYGTSQMHQAITILIHGALEAEAWWSGVGSSDSAPGRKRQLAQDAIRTPATTRELIKVQMCAPRRTRDPASGMPGYRAGPVSTIRLTGGLAMCELGHGPQVTRYTAKCPACGSQMEEPRWNCCGKICGVNMRNTKLPAGINLWTHSCYLD